MSIFKRSKEKKRVLVVEDDEMLSNALVTIIEDSGYLAEKVENGLEVLEKAGTFNPDLILLDIILPGLDGFGVLKELKNESKLKSIPVVILSNLDKPADVKSVKILGAVDYIIKARVDMEEVVKIIKKYIKK